MADIYHAQYVQSLTLLEAARQAKPTWVLLEAPFGAGKSTFLQRIVATLTAQAEWRIISLRGLSRNLPPYWGAIRLFDELTQKSRHPWAAARKWSDPLAQAVGIVPVVGGILSTLISAGKVVAEDQESRLRERFIRPDPIAYEIDRSIMEALESASKRRPLFLAIDDLQLLDPPTLAVLQTVLAVARGRVCGMLTLERGGSDESDALAALAAADSEQRIVKVTLPSLSADESRALACEYLQAQRLDPVLDEQLIALSGSNPWLLKTIARMLLDQHAIEIEHDYAHAVIPMEDVEIGSSIRQLLERRLHQLDAVSLASARKASLVGPMFPARLVRSLLSSLPGDAVLTALNRLEAEDVVINVKWREGNVWAFLSHLLWDLLRNEAEAVEEDSIAIHRAIIDQVRKHPEYAEIIDTSFHYEKAQLYAEAGPKALNTALQEMRQENYSRATQLLERAERCAARSNDHNTERAANIAMVTVYRMEGRYAASVRTARELEQRQDLLDSERAEVMLQRAKGHAHLGEWDLAIDAGTQSSRLAQQAHVPLLEILGRNAINTAGGLGPWDPEVFRASARHAAAIGEPILAAQSRGLEAQGDLFDGRPLHAAEILERLRYDSALTSYPPDRHIVLNNLAIAYSLLEQHTAALRVFDELIVSAGQSRDRWGHAVAYLNRSAARLRAGDTEAAIADGKQSITLLRDMGSAIGEPYLNYGVAQAVQDIQQRHVVSKEAEEAIATAQHAAEPYWRIWERGSLRLNVARLTILQQDGDRAVALLNALIEEPGRYRYRLVEAARIAEQLPQVQRESVHLPPDIDRIAEEYPDLQSTLFQRPTLGCTGHFICRGWAL